MGKKRKALRKKMHGFYKKALKRAGLSMEPEEFRTLENLVGEDLALLDIIVTAQADAGGFLDFERELNDYMTDDHLEVAVDRGLKLLHLPPRDMELLVAFATYGDQHEQLALAWNCSPEIVEEEIHRLSERYPFVTAEGLHPVVARVLRPDPPKLKRKRRHPASSILPQELIEAFDLNELPEVEDWVDDLLPQRELPADPEVLLEALRQLIDAERFPDALELLHRALTSDPHDEVLWMVQGTALAIDEQWDSAVRSFERVIELQPLEHQAYLSAGKALVDAGRKHEALPYLRQAHKLAPDDEHDIQLIYAQTLNDTGSPAEAEPLLRQLLPIITKHVDQVLQALARSLIKQGAYPEALEVLAGAIEHNRHMRWPYTTRAEVFLMMGDADSAIAEMAGATADDMSGHDLMEYRIQMLCDLRRYDLALEAVDLAIDRCFYHREYYIYKARLEDLLGNDFGALKACEGIEIHNEGWEEASLLRIYHLRRLGQPHEALAVASRLVRHNPHRALLRYHEGVLLLQQGRPAQALRTLERGAEIDPADPDIAWALSEALAHLRRPEDALAAVERCQRHAPGSALLQRQRGLLLEALGRPEDAHAALAACAELAPDPQTIEPLARVTAQLGRTDEALELIAEALGRCPESAGLWALRGGLLRSQGQLPAAQRAYESALGLEPRSPSRYERLAEVLAWQGLHEQALAIIERGLALEDWSPHLPLAKARALLALGRHADALDALRHVPPEPETQLEVLAIAAWARIRLGRHAEAEALIAPFAARGMLPELPLALRGVLRQGPQAHVVQ